MDQPHDPMAARLKKLVAAKDAQVEALMSREEMVRAEELKDYFRIPADFREMNYDSFFVHGEQKISTAMDYNSHNADRLDLKALKTLLAKVV